MHVPSIALLLLAGTSTAQGNVWVVAPSPGPGIDFTSIQAAVNAASEGDTVLLRDGQYREDVLVDGKSLAVFGCELGFYSYWHGCPDVVGSISVVNLAPHQWFVLDGPAFYAAVGSDSPRVRLTNDAGAVWVSAPAFGSAGTDALPDGRPTVEITDCSMVFLRGLVVGGAGKTGTTASPTYGAGGPAVHATRSNVYARAATLLGGRAGDACVADCASSPALACCGSCKHGGAGLLLDDSSSYLHVSHVMPGYGGFGIDSPTVPCSGGSFSIVLLGASTAQSLASLIVGSIAPPGASLSVVADPPRHLLVPGSAASEGKPLIGSLEGVTGDLAVLLLDGAPASSPIAACFGQLLLPPSSLQVFPKGVLPAVPQVQFSFTIGELGPGIESVRLFVQGAMLSPDGVCHLANPAAILLLDAQF